MEQGPQDRVQSSLGHEGVWLDRLLAHFVSKEFP